MPTLLPTSLEFGEDYATIADVLECDDLPQATIRVPQWKRHGRVVAIRVRGPSLAQLALIDRESISASGKVDEVAQIEATLRECILVPKFDVATASRLRQKNPTALRQIAQFCLALGQLDQEYIDGVVQSLARASAAPTPDAGDPPADTGA